MSRSNDAAAGLVTALFWYAVVNGWSRTPWWRPEYTDKGGRGAGPGATTTPVPQGGANLWSEVTMRVFAEQMYKAGINARLVLLGIAAASNFNADEALGDNVGLLLVRNSDLATMDYPGEPPFETLDAVHQIPWIAKVLAYRMADTGGAEPGGAAPEDWSKMDEYLVRGVGELALLLHPQTNPNIATYVRNEAMKRAKEALARMLHISHDNLLRHVLANP